MKKTITIRDRTFNLSDIESVSINDSLTLDKSKSIYELEILINWDLEKFSSKYYDHDNDIRELKTAYYTIQKHLNFKQLKWD